MIEFTEISDPWNWLDEQGYLREGTGMLTWPYPDGGDSDPVFSLLTDDDRVTDSFTAVGQNDASRFSIEERYPSVTSLDAYNPQGGDFDHLLKGGVTSHDVAQMRNRGVLEEVFGDNIDIEYARDFGMAFTYNPDLGRKTSGLVSEHGLGDRLYEELAKSEEELLYKLASESAAMTDRITIVDLHDLPGMYTFSDLKNQRDKGKISNTEMQNAHILRVARAYNDNFQEVTTAEIKPGENSFYSTRPWIIAKDPL
jgi:hypothetical protein